MNTNQLLSLYWTNRNSIRLHNSSNNREKELSSDDIQLNGQNEKLLNSQMTDVLNEDKSFRTKFNFSSGNQIIFFVSNHIIRKARLIDNQIEFIIRGFV